MQWVRVMDGGFPLFQHSDGITWHLFVEGFQRTDRQPRQPQSAPELQMLRQSRALCSMAVEPPALLGTDSEGPSIALVGVWCPVACGYGTGAYNRSK